MNGALDATARLGERRRAVRRHRLAVGVAAALLVLVVVAAWWTVAFSGVFGVRDIEVAGTAVLTPDAVRQAAGVGLGSSLALVDTGAVADRVAGLRPVSKVTVERVWPDALRVDIAERKPAMAIPSGSSFLIADATGVVFDATATFPASLIRVNAKPGDKQAIADAGTVFSALSPATAKRVREVEAASPDSIGLLLDGGQRVVWGGTGQSSLKSQVLDLLLAHKASVYDVSAPAHPATR